MSWWVVLTAVLMGLAIAWVGIVALRAASGPGPRENPEVEDVEGVPGDPAWRAPDPQALWRADGGRPASRSGRSHPQLSYPHLWRTVWKITWM